MDTPTIDAIAMTVDKCERELAYAECQYSTTVASLRTVMQELDDERTTRLSERTALLDDISLRMQSVQRLLTQMRSASLNYRVARQTFEIVRVFTATGYS